MEGASKIQDLEEAQGLATAIVSDLMVFHDQRITEGIRSDSLFEFLSDEIEEARNYYENAVAEDVLVSTNFFNRAIVDLMVYAKSDIPSRMW